MRCECESCGVAAHRRVALRRCRCWRRGWRWRDWRAALRVVPRWPAPARYVGCRMRTRIGLAGYRVHGRGGRWYTPRCPGASTRGLHGQEFERGAHVRARTLILGSRVAANPDTPLAVAEAATSPCADLHAASGQVMTWEDIRSRVSLTRRKHTSAGRKSHRFWVHKHRESPAYQKFDSPANKPFVVSVVW